MTVVDMCPPLVKPFLAYIMICSIQSVVRAVTVKKAYLIIPGYVPTTT
jgi:hypothetical protein